jgi:sugar lactone lactonase YvrE
MSSHTRHRLLDFLASAFSLPRSSNFPLLEEWAKLSRTGRWQALVALPVISASVFLASCGADNNAAPDPPGANPAATPTHLAVSDTGNCRVLLYDTPLTTDENASVVLGEANFTAQGNCQEYSRSSASTIAPDGLAIDAGGGNLFVADPNFCRVVMFAPPFTNGMSASLVLGQTGFASPEGSCSTSGASGMMFPKAVAVDGSGDVWVADENANRVTEFVPPFTNGMAASLVIGQTSFQGTGCNEQQVPPSQPTPPATSSSLCGPASLAFDTKGDLWVGDWQNFRVLEFTPPFTTGMAASVVLGQTASLQGAVGFASGLAFDANGDLWMSDMFLYRVLEFTPPFTNGMAASTVVGEPNFLSIAPGSIDFQATPSNLNAPSGLTFDSSGDLIVTTSANSRAMIFVPPFSDGLSATSVLGEPNLTSGAYDGCAPAAANSLCDPLAVLAY